MPRETTFAQPTACVILLTYPGRRPP
jgi:hypothetical protein